MTFSEQHNSVGNSSETPDILPAEGNIGGVYWSLNQTHRITKVPKGTLSKDAAAGKIQWHDRPEGKKFHAPEIYSFYGDRLKRYALESEQQNSNKTGDNSVSASLSEQLAANENTSKHTEQPPLTAIELAAAQTEIRMLRERLEDKEHQITELREDRNRWHKAYEEFKLLPAPTPEPAAKTVLPETPEVVTPVQKPSFWNRIMGK